MKVHSVGWALDGYSLVIAEGIFRMDSYADEEPTNVGQGTRNG
jgi:hypothetical protein